MKKEGYYSSGEFARMAHVTLRTIRYYDKQELLKPSYVTDSGARFYTDEDFARLSQILLLKYLGFSLEDIREMLIDDCDYHFMLNSLNIQLKLVRDRIEQMQLVEKAIQDTADAIGSRHTIDWNRMLDLIHLTGMEKSLKNQYQNATNISSRINLHSLYSQNRTGWFPWIYDKCRISDDMKILETGCGDGALWTQSIASLPSSVSVTLSDISEGMLRDARRAIGRKIPAFLLKFLTAKTSLIPMKPSTLSSQITYFFTVKILPLHAGKFPGFSNQAVALSAVPTEAVTCRRSVALFRILTIESSFPQTAFMSVSEEKTVWKFSVRFFPG